MKELERYGLKLGDKANAVALISASNLDSNMKLHVESVARNLNNNRGLVQKEEPTNDDSFDFFLHTQHWKK